MTYSQIWNTIEHLFSENAKLAEDANEFFGVGELDEILTKDGMSIRFRKLTNSYEVSFNAPLKTIRFLIKKFGNTSYQRSEYELVIKSFLSISGSGSAHIEEGVAKEVVEMVSKDMGFFTRYVRDWKLKNILE